MEHTTSASRVRDSRALSAVWPWALVLLVGSFVLLPKLGQFGLWDPWEPKYAQAGREMVERGSWAVPYYLGEVRLAKPILTYWGVIAGSLVVGFNELGARLGGVLLALATLCGVYYVVSRLRGRRAGLLSALVLCTVPQFYLLARQAVPEVYLFTTLGLALLFIALGLFEPGTGETRRDVHFAIGYVCVALSILAKGPVISGVVLFVTLAIYAVVQLDTARLLRPPLRRATLRWLAVTLPLLPLLLSSAVAAFWFGTTTQWWSWSDEVRQSLLDQRTRYIGLAQHLHLPEILLAGLALVLAGWTVRIVRQGVSTPARIVLAAGLALGGLAAGLAAAAADTSGRILVLSVLVLAGCLLLLGQALRRLLRAPQLWPDVQPWIAPLTRQALMFASILAVVALPWHLVILFKQRNDFFTDFILYNNVYRLSEEINNSGNTTFYMRTLVFGYFPWSCFLPAAMIGLVRWREKDALRKFAFEAFLLVACAVGFTAFSGAATKFSHYLAAIVVPLAVVLGLIVDRLLEDRDSSDTRMGWILAAMLYLLPARDFLVQGEYRYVLESFTVKRSVPHDAEPGSYFAALIVVFAAALIASIVARSRVWVGVLVLGAVLLGHYCADRFVPQISHYKSMKYLCESWRRYADPGSSLGFFGEEKYGVHYYVPGDVKMIGSIGRFLEFMDPRKPALAIVERKKLATAAKAFIEKYPGQQLFVVDGTHLDYLLAGNRPDGAGAAVDERGRSAVADDD